MTRDELKQHITLYKKTENDVFELENKFGIRIWDSKEPNFYNNYNLIIHRLLADIFGETKSEFIEDYIFEQVNISFDELCEYLNI